MRDRNAVWGVAGVLAVSLCAATLAAADSASLSDPARDVAGPTDGPKRNFDLIEATMDHANSGDLIHTATVRGSIDRFPILRLDTDNDSACEFFLRRGRSRPKTKIISCDTGERVASATGTRLDDDTIRYRLAPEAAGITTDYYWRFSFERNGSTTDAIPDVGYAAHCGPFARAMKRFCF